MPSINSKTIAAHIESQIVRLIQTIQIEHKCDLCDAKETARDLLIRKHNELMDPELKEKINNSNYSNDINILLRYLRLK